MKYFTEKYFTVLSLIIIAIYIHIGYFNFWSVLFDWDWGHWTNLWVKNLLNFWWWTFVNYNNFWFVNIQLPFNLFMSIWWIIWNYDVATKITFFIPISLLSLISPYALTYFYTKNTKVSFLVSLFFWLNTYIATWQIPILFVFALTPLLILFFHKFLNNLNNKDFFIFIFLYFIWICYEIRIMFIVSILLIIYFLFFWIENLRNKLLWKYVLIFIIFQLFLNSFWLIPTILSKSTLESIWTMTNRWLFWSFLFNILYSFNLFNQTWTGWIPNQNFIPQSIPFYLWLYPVLIFISALYIKKLNNSSKKLILYWFVISLLWIILTKQSAEPFVWLYQWLYDNFPWFNLFREASKFFIIILLWYSIILWIFLDFIYKNKRKLFYFIWILIILISSIIAKPLITKEIGTLYIAKIEPKEYIKLNDEIIKQDNFFKTLWFPTNPQWAHFDITKPKISMVSIIDNEYKDFLKTPSVYRNNQSFDSYIFEPISDKLLDISWIKYLAVWLEDNQDDFFKSYWSSPDRYYQKLKEFSFLKELKIDWINEVKIFENTWYLSPIFTSNELITKNNFENLQYKNTDFIQINPSYYKVKIHLNWDENINLSQKKNINWNLIVWDFIWYDYFIKKPLLITKNSESLDFINSWTISKSEIIKYVNEKYWSDLKNEWYPKNLWGWKNDYKYYILNSDWSIDLNITLYFMPQSYFYIWIIISSTTFILLIWYFLLTFIKSKRNKIKT